MCVLSYSIKNSIVVKPMLLQLPGSGFGDFVVDGSPCDVAYNGVRGATVNTFLDADMFARIIIIIIFIYTAP